MNECKVVCIENAKSNVLKVGTMYMAEPWDINNQILIVKTINTGFELEWNTTYGTYTGILYPKDWFISVEEYRQIKLEELGI